MSTPTELVIGASDPGGTNSMDGQRSQVLVERVLVTEVKPGLSELSVTHGA
jgi:hypothetical protein